MRKFLNERKKRLALHEAGHAVMCHLLKCPFDYVMVDDREWHGCLNNLNGFNPKEAISVLLAGIAAESLFYID